MGDKVCEDFPSQEGGFTLIISIWESLEDSGKRFVMASKVFVVLLYFAFTILLDSSLYSPTHSSTLPWTRTSQGSFVDVLFVGISWSRKLVLV